MGIWLIIYQVAADKQAEYLDWFHQIHVAEKLARPGYDWAAHYSGEASLDPGMSSVDQAGRKTYAALFGSHDSCRAFYDPSPAQLKPRQDELTRTMIACRENVRMMILTQEWSVKRAPDVNVVDASVLQIQLFSSEQDDQVIGAWCAQQQFPELSSDSGCLQASKLLASTGQDRHVVLQFRDEALPAGGENAPQLDLDMALARCWPQAV